MPISRVLYTSAFLVLTVLLLQSCGSDAEDTGTADESAESVPQEQVLYRDAVNAFKGWMQSLSRGGSVKDGYAYLTGASKASLKSNGILSPAEYEKWFETHRARDEKPFGYVFSGVNILDVDLTDTTKAVITAEFNVRYKDADHSSVGIFYAVRERNAYRIPFARYPDYIRGWWKKEQEFDTKVTEAGLRSLASDDLGIEFSFPMSWDASDNRSFNIPYLPEVHHGIVLEHSEPTTQEIETVVRIALLSDEMVDPQLRADTTIK
ncbi:MAG: hypothetical protein CL946_12690, partial [Ectothiorhodospiraceae bacterium]|nr:hypothetical protein [Ectothiorhodospiraceae bacterium]